MNGAPAKPISGVAPSSRASSADRLGDEADVRPASSAADRVDVVHRRDRLRDHRADPGLDVEVDAGGVQRHHDVGEEDRRVDPVPAHRLQGDLGDQVGRAAGLEHRHVGPDRPVLRQRPPGLAHEPDRRVRRPARGGRPGRGRKWKSSSLAIVSRVGRGASSDRPVAATFRAYRASGPSEIVATVSEPGRGRVGAACRSPAPGPPYARPWRPRPPYPRSSPGPSVTCVRRSRGRRSRSRR